MSTTVACKAIKAIFVLFCVIVTCADKPRFYATINITSITSSSSFEIFPLSNEHFALIWRNTNSMLYVQVFKPDVFVGHMNATVALPLQAHLDTIWDSLVSSTQNGMDYIAIASTPPTILFWNGKTLQVKLLQMIKGDFLSVVRQDSTFKFGSFNLLTRTYSVHSVSMEGIIISQQNYSIPDSIKRPRLGCGVIFQLVDFTLSALHLNGGRFETRPFQAYDVSRQGCALTWLYTDRDGNNFLYSFGFENEHYSSYYMPTSFPCPGMYGPSRVFMELKDQYVTVLCPNSLTNDFSFTIETSQVGPSCSFGMQGAPGTIMGVTRVTQLTTGITFCSESSCVLQLYTCLNYNDRDVNVVKMISALENAPSYFKHSEVEGYPLWLNNLRFFPELKWIGGQLYSINMSGYNLRGPIPTRIGDSSLNRIDLSNNHLTGNLSLFEFPRWLSYLNVANNSLTGCPLLLAGFECFLQHNMLAGPYDSCSNASTCHWGNQHYVMKKLEPAQPSPPWYLTPFKWPNGVYEAAVTYWKDMLVFAGGRTPGGPAISTVSYFTASNGWSTLGQLYKERRSPSIVTLGPYLIVSGGFIIKDNQENSVLVDIYNIRNNSWSLSHLEYARGEHSAVVVDEEVWFGPDYQGSGFIEVFNPTLNTWRTIEERVSGKMIVTPYAVVTSKLIYNRDRKKWTTFEGTTSKLSVAHGSKVLLTGANGKLGLYDTYSGLWEYPNFPVGLAAQTSSVVSSENCLMFLTFTLKSNYIVDISLMLFNLTSNSGSSLVIPNAKEQGTLIATEKRQVWIVLASQLTAFTWKGFRPATKPPIIGYTPNTPAAAVQPLSAPLSSVNPVAALTPDTPVASPMTALVPKSNPPGDLTTDSTPIWPIFLVLAIVLLVGVVAGYFWFKKRRAKLVSEDEVSLLDNQDFASLQIDKEDVSNPGDIPFGEIKIGEKLGEGSYGDIFKAVWHGQKVVVKMLKSKHLDQSILIEEAKTLISLRHKHIVLSMGLSKNDETDEAMLVMEYMKNGSLENLLFNEKIKLTREEITRLALDVAKGLNYLHSLNPKIIHRDLKGANVLLYHNKKRAKISDFGTARLLNTSSAASTVIGTFGFIAPEVLQQAPYNEKADIYSFGVLLFEMISNTHLAVIFEEEKRIEKISDAVTDPDFKQLIIYCCRTDQIERPSIRRCIEILKQIKTK